MKLRVASDSIHDMMGSSFQPEERLLLSSVDSFMDGPQSGPQSYPSEEKIDWTKFLALSRLHRLSSLLAYLTKREPIHPRIPDTLLEQLEGDYRWSVCHDLLLQGHLRLILLAFRDHGIPVIVLKGAALAKKLYSQIGLRPMKDIDILVRQPDVSEARSILDTLGFEGPDSQTLEDLFINHHHHIAPRLHRDTGAKIDLHWQLARPDRLHELDMEVMWANTHEVSLVGVPCRELDPIDQLIHLCVHYLGDLLGKRAGSLRQLLDIALFVRMYGDTISWPDFNERAIRYQVGSEVFTALYVCRLVLGASYPNEVDSRLRPINFNESNIEQFIVHRVIRRGSDLPISLIKALALPSWTTRMRALGKILAAPKPWIPGASGAKTVRQEQVRSISSLPARSIVAVSVLSKQIRHIKGQLIAEQWIAQFNNVRTYKGLKKSQN